MDQPTSSSSVFDGRVPYPEFASIETTMKCNLQCPMCLPYLAGSTVAGRHIDPDDFEQIARAVFPYVDSFQLTISGEPLMSKGLGRMLELAEEYGVRTEYYTNGTLLNDRMISMILPTLGQICISFDGASKETFEFLRKGATFEHVVRNIEKLSAEIHNLPEAGRPTMGFAVTVMEKNVRELPALVELAHRLHLDFVSIAHLLPVSADMQRQSLVHHVDLAKEWIGKALDRARELEVPVVVAPLDQIIAVMADTDRPSGTTDRAIAVQDGFIEGLGERAVNETRRRRSPPPPMTTESGRQHALERPAKRRREEVIESPDPAARQPLPASIWFCDFLWNRIYVTADSTVRPCCMPGVPDIADFRDGGLEGVWDNEAYRAMRIGLVRKEPVPVCRGCQGIKELTDPAEIERVLQGRSLPAPVPLPPVLLPVIEVAAPFVAGTREDPRISATPPLIAWPAVEGALGYEFEALSDDPKNALRFESARRGIELSEPRFAIPGWVWAKAPVGARIDWRGIARLPDARAVVARGSLVRVEPFSLPVRGHDATPRGPAVEAAAPPVVRWNAPPGGEGHAFEASLDDFAHVHFTSLDGGRLLADPTFAVPQAAWVQVPPGASCAWRGLVVYPDRREVVARGSFVRYPA